LKIAKLLKAFAKAAEWADANPEEAGEIVNSYTEADAAATGLKLSKGDHTITLDASKIESLRVSLAKQLQYEIITKEIDLDAHINTKYLELAGLQ
jgi:ABC-type nitrate/sulfonate/bicarbonate transport system substrate-binding protein